jgi:hypothetical protein
MAFHIFKSHYDICEVQARVTTTIAMIATAITVIIPPGIETQYDGAVVIYSNPRRRKNSII